MLNGLLMRQQRVHSQIEICRLLYTANFFAGCATCTLFPTLDNHLRFHLYNWSAVFACSTAVSVPWLACPYRRPAVNSLQQLQPPPLNVVLRIL